MSMKNGRCGRCFKETLSHTMSIFNTQEICLDCKDAETKHPRYAEARKAEEDAVRSGNYNFKGIGWTPLPAPAPPDVFVCRKCRGVNIQVLDWIDANTNKYIGTNESLGDDDTWCEDCDSNTGIELTPETPEIAESLRKRR